jgi:NAD(P)-dependent dehydrogenase (short-subunit alcohol dehydrogenase family)
MHTATESKVILITGAGRGLGRDIARAALAAGHRVVATGRDMARLAAALEPADQLLVVPLDVTQPQAAARAVQATIDRFGRLDVLINNAGSFYGGYFEEIAPAQMQAQLAVNLLGPMHVTRAVLPVMRQQGGGHVVSVSSTAGFIGYEGCSAYSASKFGLEGWMESLSLEVAPFGIHTTIVEPGFFRTELLTADSTIWPTGTVPAYAGRRDGLRSFFEGMNGQQGGDPAKLARALLTIMGEPVPPKRWVAGTDGLAEAERKVAEFQQQLAAYQDLSSALGYEASPANA